MKFLVDTDIVMDFMLLREPFFTDSEQVLVHARNNPGRGALAWHSYSNLAYFLPTQIRTLTMDLLAFLALPPVDPSDLAKAAQFPMADFEDAMQAACALSFGAQVIVSRNRRDYRGSPVPCLSPAEFLRRRKRSGR
jgi:predicted nucleic acid-binding protein